MTLVAFVQVPEVSESEDAPFQDPLLPSRISHGRHRRLRPLWNPLFLCLDPRTCSLGLCWGISHSFFHPDDYGQKIEDVRRL